MAAPLSLGLRPGGRISATIWRTALAALFLVIAVASQSLPYISTSLLVPSISGPSLNASSATVAYIVQPHDNSANVFALDLTKPLAASSTSLQLVSSGVPFYDKRSRADSTFTLSVGDDGRIYAYAGGCSPGADDVSLWTLSPSNTSTARPNEWTRVPLSSGGSAGLGQPPFLGGSLSFSTILTPTPSRPSIYVYAGMCPWRNSTISAWQESASYSNRMFKLAPTSADGAAYRASVVSAKGTPIPEAGFTFTGLRPSYLNRSGIVTQQVNHVVLGGHTQEAFVNMSTVAIWSLPEESWTFLSIASPTTGSTELAVRDSVNVESRSGHTAILNEDGTAIVVLGGWVGDVSKAAMPQLAVLEIGTSYGGSSREWRWTLPATQPSGRGVYGHGAVLLPGNVMMVYGGYSIGTRSGKKSKRQNPAIGSPLFLNLTSMKWQDEYIHPSYAVTDSSGRSPGNARGRNIGLGVGLGVGLALILTVVIAWYCYRRRLKKRHETRDEAVRALAQDASQFLHGTEEMAESDDRGWPVHTWYTGGRDPYLRDRRSLGYETIHDGKNSSWRHPQVPEGAQAAIRKYPQLRAARGYHQPTPEFTPNSRGSGAGEIHPIYETDEEHERGGLGKEVETEVRTRSTSSRDEDTPPPQAQSDPFATPVSSIAPPVVFPPPKSRASMSPSPDRWLRMPAEAHGSSSQDQEVQDWVSDVSAVDMLMASRLANPARRGSLRRSLSANSRTSPTRRSSRKSPNDGKAAMVAAADEEQSQRTGSTLSEHSPRFELSRAGSGRSHHNRGGSGSNLLTTFGSGTLTAVGTAEPHPNSSGKSSNSDSSTTNSYNTAKSSFQALQAEGPALLMGGASSSSSRRAADAAAVAAAVTAAAGVMSYAGRHYDRGDSPPLVERDDDDNAHAYESDGDGDPAPGSPSKNKGLRRNTWFGSLRRVLGGTNANKSTSSSDRDGSPSPIAAGAVMSGAAASGTGGQGSSTSRASMGDAALDFLTQPKPLGGGARLLRRKHGKEAWVSVPSGSDDKSGDIGLAWPSSPSRHHQGDNRLSLPLVDEYDDDDCDIERAVEQRLVQVMFTVPKERLRVVNAEIEEEEAVLVDPDHDDSPNDSPVAPNPSVLVSRASCSVLPSVEDPGDPARSLASRPLQPVTPKRTHSGKGKANEIHDEDVDVAAEAGARNAGPSTVTTDLQRSLSVRSAGSSTGQSPHSPANIMTAEAVRLERPRTRVLEMVETIEGRSRETTPGHGGSAGSPGRGKG